jgi:mRNA (guanine-N7-)-methyltransferase
MIEIDKFINCIIILGKIKNFIIQNNVTNIENLRKFHNFIKFNIINESCKRTSAKNLLDIACGRGGDLQKWLSNNNLQYILAFDSHKDSIFSSIKNGDNFDGAIARFLNIKKNYKSKIPYIVFKNLNILDNDIYEKLNQIDTNKKYDIISCQFAMHYFSRNDNLLNQILNMISLKLKKGGLFIGTATDGDLIYNILNNGNVNIPLLTLIKKDFNNYLFYIQTEKSKTLSRQNYFELQGVSSEFYLFKDKLKNLCSQNNLELVEYKSFYEWYQIYKKTKTFHDLSIYEMIISFLNFSFIFKKI